MMMTFLAPMMLGVGPFMMTMFSGLFGGFLWPMWTMMAGWFGFA